MKQTTLLLLWVVVSALSIYVHASDPVLMTVAGRQITRSEFEYSLNKNYDSPSDISRDDIKEYVDIFINYRLRVQAAIDQGIDTLSSFIKEYHTYRDIQLKPFVYDSLYADSVAHAVYETLAQSVGDKDLLKVSHILLAVPQNSTQDFVEKQHARIDSIYNALMAGASFTELASKYSNDINSAAAGGELPWFSPAQVIPEFYETASALQLGQYSEPVLTPVGYHIIYLQGRKKLEPYNEKKAEILQALNKRGLADDAAERMIKRLVAQSNGTMTREDVLQNVQAIAEAQDPNIKYLLNEYHDGLLLYEVSNNLVWDAAAKDKAGQEDYFNRNKDKYRWDAAHFRGYTYRAKSKDMAQKLKKLLKKCKLDEGLESIKQLLPSDSLRSVRVYFGVYKRGDDAMVDHLKFGVQEEPLKNQILPYYGVVGKILKQPKHYIDVRSQVISDYQNEMEKSWIDALRKRYSFSVDEAILSTVNNH